MCRPAHCQRVTRSSPPPPSESTSVSAVTQCYPRQPGKRLWRSNQLWLNTECDGSHYSKSRTAKALTTIDYLNIACIRCRGFYAHLCCVCLRREEVDCPPVVYWYCLSFMMTRTIFPRKCHCAVISQFSPPHGFSHVAIFVSRYCVQKQGYRITLPCLYFIIVFQNPLKQIRWPIPTGEGDIFVYITGVYTVHIQYMLNIQHYRISAFGHWIWVASYWQSRFKPKLI